MTFRNISPANVFNLKSMLAASDLTIFCNPSINSFADHLSGYISFCFDLCCPRETIFVYEHKFSSKLLNQLRCRKEASFKAGDKAEVVRLSQLIAEEIGRLNIVANKLIFRDTSPKSICKPFRKVFGMVSKRS